MIIYCKDRSEPKWEKWYAWHPIWVGSYLVWLEPVFRLRCVDEYECDYWYEYAFHLDSHSI